MVTVVVALGGVVVVEVEVGVVVVRMVVVVLAGTPVVVTGAVEFAAPVVVTGTAAVVLGVVGGLASTGVRGWSDTWASAACTASQAAVVITAVEATHPRTSIALRTSTSWLAGRQNDVSAVSSFHQGRQGFIKNGEPAARAAVR